ncbi:MAG: hypothetical protein ACTHKC_06855 [Candidatus Nitrosocosmicus sp.]
MGDNKNPFIPFLEIIATVKEFILRGGLVMFFSFFGSTALFKSYFFQIK